MSGGAMAYYSFGVAQAASALPWWGQTLYYVFILGLLYVMLTLPVKK